TTGIWTVGTVNALAVQTLTVQAKVVSPLPATNTAAISHADQFDQDLTNNSSSITETPQQANLSLAKTVDNPAPDVGDTITFTLTLTNLGVDSATNVVVNDKLPTGLTFVGEMASQGNYDFTTGVWTVGTVDPGVPQTLAIQATVGVQNALTNTATIAHSD